MQTSHRRRGECSFQRFAKGWHVLDNGRGEQIDLAMFGHRRDVARNGSGSEWRCGGGCSGGCCRGGNVSFIPIADVSFRQHLGFFVLGLVNFKKKFRTRDS